MQHIKYATVISMACSVTQSLKITWTMCHTASMIQRLSNTSGKILCQEIGPGCRQCVISFQTYHLNSIADRMKLQRTLQPMGPCLFLSSLVGTKQLSLWPQATLNTGHYTCQLAMFGTTCTKCTKEWSL